MRDVYIVSPKRSAVGKAFRGGLRTKRPDDLAADVIKGMLEKLPRFDYELIDDVYMGCAMPEAEQGMNVARFVLLLAGLPESVPGVTINRFCSSGVQTIAMAADRVRAGDAECILAGGTETMTMVPMMGHKVVGSRSVMSGHPEFYLGMGLTAENVAGDYRITRREQDEFAFASHRKASQAIEQKLFVEEIIPIKTTFRTPGKDGSTKVDEQVFAMDDGPRADTSLEALMALKPAFKQDGTGTVTAGNSSQMSDGAGMCLVVSEEFIKKHKDIKPHARFVSYAVCGVAPRVMGIGPIPAIPKALKKAGISLAQIDRFELNEAFAAQALAVVKTLGIDPTKVNPTGGAIALGHPLGATGAKLTATLLHGLKRDRQKYGIVSMCIGTGMGAAAVFEMLRKAVLFLASGFGVGYLPLAPGTFGSLLGLGLGYEIYEQTSHLALRPDLLQGLRLALLLGLALVAWVVIDRAGRYLSEHDDKRIVIDEIVGQAIVTALLPPNLVIYAIAFAVFRFFDIVKPGAVGWVDKNLKNSFGTLADDVVAGVFSAVVVLIASIFVPSV